MWPTIALAALIGKTALDAYASRKQGQAAAAVGQQNQQVAELDAQATERAAITASEQKVEEIKRLSSTQKSLYAKSGVVTTTGTPTYVMDETLTEGQKDALAILAEGTAKAKRIRAQGANYAYAGEQAEKAGTLGAVGNILSGASQIPLYTR